MINSNLSVIEMISTKGCANSAKKFGSPSLTLGNRRVPSQIKPVHN